MNCLVFSLVSSYWLQNRNTEKKRNPFLCVIGSLAWSAIFTIIIYIYRNNTNKASHADRCIDGLRVKWRFTKINIEEREKNVKVHKSLTAICFDVLKEHPKHSWYFGRRRSFLSFLWKFANKTNGSFFRNGVLNPAKVPVPQLSRLPSNEKGTRVQLRSFHYVCSQFLIL